MRERQVAEERRKSTDFDERFERLKEKKTKRSLKITQFHKTFAEI